MSSLSVTDVEAAKAQAVADEIRTIVTAGAVAGSTQVVGATLTTVQYDDHAGACANFVEAVALAVLRSARSYPVALPTFTVASVPSAAQYTGAQIYVSNGAAGAPIVAFSNGSQWLRVDTRTVIT